MRKGAPDRCVFMSALRGRARFHARAFATAIFGCAISAGAAQDGAQAYPTKPIRVIVPVTAGGSTDNTARLITHKMSELLRRPIVVDNRPGGNSIIGTDIVAKAPPDGYTLLLAFAAHITTPAMTSKLPFDLAADFRGISLLATQPLIVIVNNQLPARSIKELVALAKASPGKLNYGLPGPGSAAHIAGELFKLMSATNIVAVPYKGAAPAQLALAQNEVQLMFANVQTGLSMAKSGRVTVIAIATEKRSSFFPEVPTFAEQGIPKFDVEPWQGLMAPARTPRAIIGLLHRTAVESLRAPDVVEKLLASGSAPIGSTPEELDRRIRSQLKSWGEVVRKAGIRAE